MHQYPRVLELVYNTNRLLIHWLHDFEFGRWLSEINRPFCCLSYDFHLQYRVHPLF